MPTRLVGCWQSAFGAVKAEFRAPSGQGDNQLYHNTNVKAKEKSKCAVLHSLNNCDCNFPRLIPFNRSQRFEYNERLGWTSSQGINTLRARMDNA